MAVRKDLSGKSYSWENSIEYGEYGQIIHYPLYQYQDGRFVAGNNLDKYASFSECVINEVSTKKKLANLRRHFYEVYRSEIENGLIPQGADWTKIFIRRERFPDFLLQDLKDRYTWSV